MSAACPRCGGRVAKASAHAPGAARCALVKRLRESGAALREHGARMRPLGVVRCGTTRRFFRRPDVAALDLTVDGPIGVDPMSGELSRGPWAPLWAVMVAAWALGSTHSVSMPGHRDGWAGARDVPGVTPKKREVVLAWLAGLDPADRDGEIQAIRAIQSLAGPLAARRAAVEKAEAAR